MKLLKYTTSIVIAGVFACLSGCNNFLDINVDPNNAADTDVELLLPSAEGAIGFVLGNDLQIRGGIWAQYWTQNPNSSQYRILEQYSPAASDYDATWANINADALEDLQKVIQKSQTPNRQQYLVIAQLLKAYTLQLSTDLWGDIPMSNAFQGDAEIRNLAPTYDKQEEVYNNLIALVDSSLNLIDVNDENHPGSDDLIYGGDMELWEKFGNTLKLKLAMRLSEIAPTKAADVIKTLEGKSFIGSGETAQIEYNSTGGNQNPLYSAIAGSVLNQTQNLVASATAIQFFLNHEDPRIDAFYLPVSGSTYVGITQGDYAEASRNGITASNPSPTVGANARDPESALAPVKIISDYESDFLQAEAMARGWLSGNASELYNQGIADSFAAYNVEGLEDYLTQEDVTFPESGSIQEKVEAVITQKWAAMCGNQGIEAWTEWRRTGYPSFFTLSKASIIGADRWPGVFLYPTNETQLNPNTPAQHKVYDKVWWDIK